MKKITLMVVCGGAEHYIRSLLAPLEASTRIEKILLFRKRSFPSSEKIVAFAPPIWVQKLPILAEFWRIGQIKWQLLFGEVDAIMAVYMFPHGIIAALFAKFFRKKLVQNIIGSDLQQMLDRPMSSKITKWGDAFITRGENSRHVLINEGFHANKIWPIPNAFDFSKFHPGTVKKDIDFIFVGYLEPVKRVDLILEAFSILQGEHPKLRLYIVGTGKLDTQLRAHAAKLDLQNCEFLGHRKDIPNLLHRAKSLVLSSDSEGQPMVLLEAMACGLPVVAPNVSNIPEWVQHGENGLLVSEQSARAYAEAMRQMLDANQHKRMAEGALKIREMENEFSVESIRDAWEEIFHNLGLLDERRKSAGGNE